ncbi:MAG: aldo/keto reductase [Planctomycetota bacterium]
MRRIATAFGVDLPVLGQGTWRMGEDTRRRRAEADALRLGIDLGMTLVDTAEMYAGGGAEEVVGEAIRGRRDDVFLVSKVLPRNASREGTVRAAERSLERLGTDRVDLYLLHWPGPHPLEETVEAFNDLVAQGKIRRWGVSNFTAADMEALAAIPGGAEAAANQVVYSVERRGVEWSLLPWCAARGVLVMAYSPLDQGGIRAGGALGRVAARHGATAAQVALAFAVHREGIVAIPKAADPEHVRENAAAAEIRLTDEDLAEIDGEHPPPVGESPLEIL